MPASEVVTTIDFLGNDVSTAGSAIVYTRAHWADDWVEQPDLHCLECTWSCSPSLPTAQFRYHYGRVLQLGAEKLLEHAKLTGLARGYVKVVYTITPDPNDVEQTRYWYGVLELEVDQLLGAIVDPPSVADRRIVASGHQDFTAYGMEILLAKHRIRTSFYDDGGSAAETHQRIPFNSRAVGNRTSALVDGSYLFATDLTVAEKWHSQAIVKYLLKHQTPRDRLGAVKVPWRLDTPSEDAVTTWDMPELPQDESTTLSLLNRILDRRRLTVWWTSVDESTTPDTVVVYVDTLTRHEVPIELPGAAAIPANRSLKKLSFDEDQLTGAVVKDSDVQRYDVVTCRGAPEMSVGTFAVLDSTLSIGWDGGQQYEYEYAAQGTAGYSSAGTKEQQKRNARARGAPKLEKVFSRFEIPRDWDGRVGDGDGGPKYDFFPDEQLGGAMLVYLPEIHLVHDLPLCVGVDYSGTKIRDGVTEPKDKREELDLLVFLKNAAGKWVRGDEMARAADLEHTAADENHSLTVHVRAIPHTRVFDVRVAGAPQHAIAFGNFTRLPVDKKTGEWSYRKMLVTAALPNGKRVTGQWPPREPVGIDCVRWLEIDAGEHYRKVYVVPGTVVGVDADGVLIRSTGGYIPKPGDNDHEAQLRALAKMAAAWYTVPHRVLTLDTARLVGREALELGDMVTEIGHPTVDGGHQTGLNTPITEIRFIWPIAEDGQVEAPKMLLQTWAGELDPLQTGPVSVMTELGSKLMRPMKVIKL